VNLFVTGRATSNVIDGEKDLSQDFAGIKTRGVFRRPLIGYLTQLESLRYSTVGSHLKEPIFPIWVIGSQSHFSAIFSIDSKASDPAPESAARRVFDSFDATGGGFVAQDKIQEVADSDAGSAEDSGLWNGSCDLGELLVHC